MKTTSEILGTETFKKLESEYTLYNMTIQSLSTGELKFSKWLEMTNKPQFEILKAGVIADIEAQRIEWEGE